MNTISAHEARLMAEGEDPSISLVFQKIKEAAQKGSYYCDFYSDELSYLALHTLQDLGYEIIEDYEWDNGKSAHIYNISWDYYR